MSATKRLDTATARRLATFAEVDPRTLVRCYEGKRMWGSTAQRAREVLAAEGFLTPAPPLQTTKIELDENDIRDAVAGHLTRKGYKVIEVGVIGIQQIAMNATVEKSGRAPRKKDPS